MGANNSMGKVLTGNQDEVKKRDERISALEQQLKETTARYDKLFIKRSGSRGASGAAGGYIDRFGNRVTKAVNTTKAVKTAPTRSPSGSAGTNLKIQGTGTNLG